MQVFYSYDSAKLLKEKFQVFGLKFNGSDNDIKEINKELNKLALFEFKNEISNELSIDELFEDNNGEKFLEIYSKYFEVPDEYFSSAFINKFFKPNNYNSKFIEVKKEFILQKYQDFSEIYFQESDLDKLKLSFLLHTLYNGFENIWDKTYMTIFYSEYFKKSSSTAIWKSNSKVRKLLFLSSYFSILDSFDKVDILYTEKNRISDLFEEAKNRSGRYFYKLPFEKIIFILNREIEKIEKD